MSSIHHDKTLALAAIFQAAGLVHALAKTGRCDENAEQAFIKTSLVLDTDDSTAIYGSPAALNNGLRWLKSCLTDGSGLEDSSSIVRLTLSILQAEKHFRQHPEAQHLLRKHLVNLNANPIEDHRQLTEALAKAYVDGLSILRFRIQIHGDSRHLQSYGMAERIRAILLAGIRGAWLWQRLGGRRWHLLITRGQILQEIRDITKSV
jgi:high frequency lysogenization protein